MDKISNRTKIRVRYAETDKMGVVYNGEYFTFFEVGRCELMRRYDMPYTRVEAEGYLLPVLETHAQYMGSAFYDDELEIEAELKLEIKPYLRFEYNILRDNTTIAKGYTVHGFMKQDSRKVVKPPKFFTEYIRKMNNERNSD